VKFSQLKLNPMSFDVLSVAGLLCVRPYDRPVTLVKIQVFEIRKKYVLKIGQYIHKIVVVTTISIWTVQV
jgi:hypothetical protein